VTFSGTGAAVYRLQDSVDGGPYETVGPVKASTSRTVSVAPSASTTHRFRVIPYDAFEVQGVPAYGSTLRVSLKSDTPSTSLVYAGTWSTKTGSDFVGGRARSATSSDAQATWTFTGREVAWIAAKGRHDGHAAVVVDGVSRGTIDLDAAKSRFRRVVFRATWSTSGTHSISIRPVGDGRVILDGFELLR
jgi:hypothetical protein